MRYFRKYRREDADTIVTWVNSFQELFLWSGGCLPLRKPSGEDLDQVLHGVGFELEPWEKLHSVGWWEDRSLIGFLSFCPVNEEGTALRLGLVILAPSRRGQGLGGEMIKRGLRYAFERLGAEEVVLDVYTENTAAVRSYVSAGFLPGEPVSYERVGGKQWTSQPMHFRKGQNSYVERQTIPFF